MKKDKIKIVFIAVSEFTNRYLQDYYMDELSTKLDWEYWDCSSISECGFKAKDALERSYVVKINTLNEFEENLKRLPHDTIITLSVIKSKKNYRYLKVLSKYFKNVCEIHPNNFGMPPVSELAAGMENTQEKKLFYILRDRLKIIKEKAYEMPLMRLIFKCIRHPCQRKEIVDMYFSDKIERLFNWYNMTTDMSAEYHLNNSNVNKWMRYKQSKEENHDGKFIVYIDQYFPYHNELKIADPNWDVERIAETHFAKINKFFDKIEAKYNCPIIIAAHPTSNYNQNQFAGRELRKWSTEALVANSIGVLMHTSGSLSYAMVANKPLTIISDGEFRRSQWGSLLDNLSKSDLYIVNIDDFNQEDVDIKPIPKEVRDTYMKWIAGGEIDESKYKDNSELMAEYYIKIYQKMYSNN